MIHPLSFHCGQGFVKYFANLQTRLILSVIPEDHAKRDTLKLERNIFKIH